MPDLELENMELEYTLKSLRTLQDRCKAQQYVLNKKAEEKGCILAEISKKILMSGLDQNRDVELYGKTSFEASYNRAITNTWCDCLRMLGYDIKFEFADDLIHDMTIYTETGQQIIHYVLR